MKDKLLNNIITLNEFKQHYFDKKDLIAFCKKNNIPSQGGKPELNERITLFFQTGQIINITKIPKSKRDSENIITRETAVINYKNDAKTKEFFITEIGAHFHFNAYLRKFTKAIDSQITYGDLINGWRTEENKKKSRTYVSVIDKQFEYNQFQRDFYKDCNDRKKMIEAWKFVRSIPGPKTYAHYLVIKNNK